jgi:hypothetical protein
VLGSEDFTAMMEDLRAQIVEYVQQQQQQPTMDNGASGEQ